MATTIRPSHEPLRATVLRNGLIAIIAATVITVSSSHSAQPIRWPIAFITMLWPTFGGHWLEVWYLNWLRPRLPSSQSLQRLARLATWFVAGCVLGVGMVLTARAIDGSRFTPWPAWWFAGVAFIGIELVVHAGVQARGQPSFYNGRG
jgi:hypothetical protein